MGTGHTKGIKGVQSDLEQRVVRQLASEVWAWRCPDPCPYCSQGQHCCFLGQGILWFAAQGKDLADPAWGTRPFRPGGGCEDCFWGQGDTSAAWVGRGVRPPALLAEKGPRLLCSGTGPPGPQPLMGRLLGWAS